MKKIPKKFTLGGQLHTVEMVDDLLGDDGAYGRFLSHTNRIQIANNLAQDKAGHTFYHELVHAILSCMNHELNEDEDFVDTFGLFLHQYEVSKWGQLPVQDETEDE